MSRRQQISGVLTALTSLAAGAARRATAWDPPPQEAITPVGDGPPAPRGHPLRVLVWNIQFCGSRKHHFFYDGGRAVHVPAEDVAATLDGVGRVIRRADCDLVLLQEVDRGSDRTGRVDQHAALLAASGLPCHASAPYHRSAWVPHPAHHHLGRVEVHLSTFSRFRLVSATRRQLALMDEPWWRATFNLKRAVLDARVALDDGRAFAAQNTHLSAFSRGDGTLDRQVEALFERCLTLEDARVPWLLAGDMNALPPGDDPRRLGPTGAAEHPEAISPIAPLFQRFHSAISEESHRADPARWRTWVPWGGATPERAIDHAFVGGGVEVEEVQVLPETAWSDHLPIRLTIRLPA
jgi:endonuclease/exonuclease/phosphatase family metal-dependent hydrolase